jgi:hypothetical protein
MKPSKSKPRKPTAPVAARSFSLTTAWAAAILALLVIVFFHQVALEGQTFVAPDATQPVGFVRVGEHALYQQHTYPLWNPFVFLGMPSFGSGAYNPLIYPPDWPLALVAKVIPLPDMTWLLLYYFLGGLFFFLLAREWGARPEGALLGGLAFVFAPNLVAVGSHGHGSQLVDSAYLPLLLWLASRWMRRGGLQHLGWLALAGGFQMLRGHAQIAFYTWFAVGLYVLFEILLGDPGENGRPAAPLTARLVRAAGVGGAMALAFGLAGFYNLPLRDYASHSIRGGGADGGVGLDYATAWSMGPWELPAVMIPGWVGFGGGTYWGGMPFTDYPNAYVGAITVVLALAAIAMPGRVRLYALALAGVSLLISFGKYFPLYGFLYQHLPLFNKFRVPVMIVLLFQLAATLGLAWGWTALIGGAHQDDPRLGRLMKGIAVVLGLALVVGLLGQDGLRGGYLAYARAHRPDLPVPALDAAYRGFIGDLMRVSLLGLLAVGAGILALRRRLPAALATVAVLVLLLIELWPVSGMVMAPVIGPRVPNTLDQGHDDVVAFFEKAGAPGTFRILPVAEYQSNRFAGFSVGSIGGYHAAKPKLFQDLVEAGVIEAASGMVRGMNPYWMRLLNVRYVVTPQPLQGPEAKPVFEGSQLIYENRPALPRAMVLGEYRVAPVAHAIIDSVASGTHDSATMTWLEKDPGLTLGPVAGATARISRYDLNDLSIDVDTPGSGLLRLADLWYPDWVATVDGKPAEILRADYLLRAVAVPSGKHRVDFHYRSAAVRRGLTLSLASLAGVLALLAAGMLLGRRTPKVAEA